MTPCSPIKSLNPSSMKLWLQTAISATFLLMGSTAYADQLAWLSRTEAEAAMEYFKTINKTVLLACYCCDDPEEQWLTYTEARIEDTGVSSRKSPGNYYEVVLSNSMVSKKVDLAYVHVDVHGVRLCVGEVLNMPCDPCSAPADVSKYRVTSAYKNETDFTSTLINSGSHLELVQRDGSWFMNHVWIYAGSHSCGPIRNIETEEIPETDDSYAMNIITFDWDYANSYDDETGTCAVVFTVVFKPDETPVIVQMETEDEETWVYQAIMDNRQTY